MGIETLVERAPSRLETILDRNAHRVVYAVPDALYRIATGNTKDEELTAEQETTIAPSRRKRIARRALYELFDNTHSFLHNIISMPRRLRDPATRGAKDIAYNAALVFSELVGFGGTFVGAYVAKKQGWGDYPSAIFGSPIGNYLAAVTAAVAAYYPLVRHHFDSFGSFAKETGIILLKNIPLAILAYTIDAPFTASFVAAGVSPAGAANITYFMTSGMFMTLSNVINARALSSSSSSSGTPL